MHSVSDEEDEEDVVVIIEDELRRALAKNKETTPGDDGMTYTAFGTLQKVHSNPFLQLYNLCFRLDYVPQAWTHSTSPAPTNSDTSPSPPVSGKS